MPIKRSIILNIQSIIVPTRVVRGKQFKRHRIALTQDYRHRIAFPDIDPLCGDYGYGLASILKSCINIKY